MQTVSIILPLFNGEKFIEETLLAVGGQSFSDAELIIIDDGSTDNSPEIIKNIRDTSNAPILKNLKILTKKNGGVASARNYGINIANGKLLAFLDQDDIWLPDKLQKQVEKMEKTGAVFCYTAFSRFYSDGKEIPKQNGYNHRKKTLRALISGNLFIPPSSVIVKKDIAEREGGFDSSLIPSDEWDFFLTILEKHEPAYCSEILVKFRSHPTSTAKKQKKKIFEAQMKVIEKHLSAAKENDFYDELKKREANVLWHLGNEYLTAGDKKSARDFYIKAIKNNPTRIKFISSYLKSLLK